MRRDNGFSDRCTNGFSGGCTRGKDDVVLFLCEHNA